MAFGEETELVGVDFDCGGRGANEAVELATNKVTARSELLSHDALFLYSNARLSASAVCRVCS